jgi:hypothetical protein
LGAIAFVEVLDRRGAVLSRTRLDDVPATIGRAYNNDVILDDRYVCPTHAILVRDEDGRLVLEDADSVNGLYVPGRQGLTARVPIESRTLIRVGHTRLRIVRADAEVPAAALDQSADSKVEQLARSRKFALVSLAVVVVFAGISMYLESFDENMMPQTVGIVILVPLLLAMWAGAWSLASRIVVQRFEFAPHMAVVSAVLLATLLYDEIGNYLLFLFPSGAVGVSLIVGGFAITVGLLYGHLIFASTLDRRRRMTWAIGVSLALFALGGLIGLAVREEFNGYTDDPGVLKPVGSGWIPARTADDYIASLSRLKAEVDDLAVEEQ